MSPSDLTALGIGAAANAGTALLVTVDELRAVHRLARLCLPRFVLADDAENPRVDAAAVRGLVARRLAVLDFDRVPDSGVLVVDPLDALLAPCRAAQRIVEIDLEVAGVSGRHTVLAGAGDAAVVVTQLPGGLVALRFAAEGVLGEVSRLCQFDQIAAPSSATGFTVGARAHRHADELALDGAAPAAVEVLTAAGVPEPVARAWIGAVCGRRCAVGVSVARTWGGPDGPFEVGEVRWLVGGNGTAWRVNSVEPAEHEEDESAEDALSVLSPVTVDELRRALELGLIGTGRS